MIEKVFLVKGETEIDRYTKIKQLYHNEAYLMYDDYTNDDKSERDDFNENTFDAAKKYVPNIYLGKDFRTTTFSGKQNGGIIDLLAFFKIEFDVLKTQSQ